MSMERELRLGPGRRAFAWIVLCLFIAGFVWSPLGVWTSPILGAWFVSAQRPLPGLVRLATIQFGLSIVTGLFGGWAPLIRGMPDMLVAIGIGLASLLAWRLLSPRIRPGLAAVALPAFTVALTWGLGALVPASRLSMVASTADDFTSLYVTHAIAGVVVWGWIRNWRGGFLRASLTALPVLLLPLLAGRLPHAVAAGLPADPLVLSCVALAIGVVGLARLARPFAAALAPTTADLAILRAPGVQAPLALDGDGLTAADGRVFPVRAGVARFVDTAGLDGQNGRLSRLYRNLAGFYDDIQRIYSALRGLDRAAYVRDYLRDLDPRPGARVLETSIGTGLSFQSLRPDIEVFGVDLSAPMLDVCRANFSRWRRRARLYLANAEALPFADESFDCVFHVGGINFFDDKAAAIAEMIRVARPGARILIADETEKHVKAVYEAVPVTRGVFQDREGPVAAPLALIPPAMGPVSFRTLMNDQFYVIAFVKPGANDAIVRGTPTSNGVTSDQNRAVHLDAST